MYKSYLKYFVVTVICLGLSSFKSGYRNEMNELRNLFSDAVVINHQTKNNLNYTVDYNILKESSILAHLSIDKLNEMIKDELLNQERFSNFINYDIRLTAWVHNSNTNKSDSDIILCYSHQSQSLYFRANDQGSTVTLTAYGEIEKKGTGLSWVTLDSYQRVQFLSCGSDQAFGRVTCTYTPTNANVSALLGCDD